MTSRLTKYPFIPTDLNLPEVQAFSCGAERWDVEVAAWIKSPSGPNSVLEDMRQFGTEVWLHRTDAGVFVGYSSLGQTTYTWPPKSKRKEVVSVIPFIGIDEQFKGEPKGASRDDKFAYQILDELLAVAAGKTERYPLVVLSVDRENKRAIRFYEYRGFVNLNLPRTDQATGIVYERMVRSLTDLIPS
jgi:ribosomal protein S18 acetylase RimI-like enzyme